ncbi:MAG: glycerol-3-phosphate 1-O-acyltransferase PlsY [Chloroflexi bacterium]|nr:glycerol-3-phosphate 1-O-acyltransferase PlsY [Chloroflexota bacterium]
MSYVIVVLVSYLLGAVPWGLVVGRLRGVDLLGHGSGRIGTANTLRTLGRRAAAVVLAADVAKGVAAVLLARYIIGTPWGEVTAALAAVVGHNWSLYIRFRGGRGVATSLGTMLAISPGVALLCAALGVGLIAWSRYVSLGSIVGAIAAPALLAANWLWGGHPLPYLLYGILAGALVVFQHHDNIQRLLSGTERRIGEPSAVQQ